MAFIVDKIQPVLVFLFLVIIFNPITVNASSQVPCFFIFGDSLIDNGNNNPLNTLAKGNYTPYGIDFPRGPTGRFTNGRTFVDFLSQFLGFKDFIPPFATATRKEIIKGVNYGSASAGIRDETAQHVGERISLNAQLQNHNLTISRIVQLLRNKRSARKHLSKCLYMSVMGSNDYINNYFLPQLYPTSQNYTTAQYADVLTQQYSLQLKTMYNYGARKIAVTGLGQLGCVPGALARRANGSVCVDSINDAITLFNDKLKVLVDDLNKNIIDAKFVYVSSMTGNLTQLLPGMVIDQPCCNVTQFGLCVPGEAPCPHRDLYAFFDDAHPTEIVVNASATSAFVEIEELLY